MYDVVQEHIKKDPTIIRLKKELKEANGNESKLHSLDIQLRIAQERVKHGIKK